MGQIISEMYEYIGSITDEGYICGKTGRAFAWINESGHIVKLASSDILGKIDRDGTIRNPSMDVVGRIQADGYVYIHSKRVCRVTSTFIEKITPNAWNAGQISSYSGRSTSQNAAQTYASSTSGSSFFTSSFFIKLVIGIIMGIIAMANGAGGIAMLLAGPIFVFLFCFIWKIFN